MDLSLTNLSFTMLFVVILGIYIFKRLYRGRLIPRIWQLSLEMIFIFIYRLIFQQVGKEGLIYFSFIFSLFTFILFLNLFSLLPYSFAVTSHLIWTLYFSLSICLGVFFIGVYNHQVHFFRLFVPEVPFLLYPMMIFIEIFSYVLRSFSLAIRLSANIIAGHTLVHIISDLIFFLGNVKSFLILFPFLLLLVIFVLEMGIAFLQAYIFVTLICMYLNDSVHLTVH